MPRSLRDEFGGEEMVKLSSYLTADVREALSMLHEEHHVPVARMLDTALRDYFTAYTKLHPRTGKRTWLAGGDRRAIHYQALKEILW